jgi:hypothetical protein
MLAMVCHSTLAIWVYISIPAVTPACGSRRTPVGASMLAKNRHSTLARGCTYPFLRQRPPMVSPFCRSEHAREELSFNAGSQVYISIPAATATYGSPFCRSEHAREELSSNAGSQVYISIPSATATFGFALTASHLEKRNAARPQVTKGSCPRRSVPR